MPSFGFGKSSSSSKQQVDAAQQPFLDFMRNRAQQEVMGMDMSQFYGMGQDLTGAGMGFLNTLGGNNFTNRLRQMSRFDTGRVSQNIDQLGADLGRQFNQQVLPGIQTEAIGLGAGGGARQGVAEGMAAQGFADALQRGSNQIINDERARNLQAATTGGGLMAQSAMGGLQGLQNVFNMGLAPFQAQFMPLLNMNQIVGPPTVLGKSSSSAFNIGAGAK